MMSYDQQKIKTLGYSQCMSNVFTVNLNINFTKHFILNLYFLRLK